MTKSLPFPENYFDAITALYSLGTLKNEEELKDAIANFHKLLKTGGKFLHTNTNGTNANNILPEYTWRGLSQKSGVIKEQLKKFDFTDIIEQTIKVNGDGIYKFNTVSVICSTKK